MANPNSVKILEETRVTPSNDSPNSPKEISLPLTFLDTYWLKFPPVDCLYFYQLTESTSTPSYFNTEILPRLKQSLGLALLHYLPLAGKIKWPSDSPKPFLSYTPNDSVSLTVAESTADDDFRTFTGYNMYQSNLLHHLVPPLMISDDVAEILSLQITLFPHQGFSIGITTHHSVVDGIVATMIMKSWAYLFKHGNEPNPCLPPELTPNFDKGLMKDPKGLDSQYLNDWMTYTSSDSDTNKNKRSLKIWQDMIRTVSDDMLRATFVFTREDINKLREMVSLEKNDAKQLRLSTFVLTYSYLLTCIVKAKEGEVDRLVLAVVGVDFRARLNPPLPTTYFGNCTFCCKTSAEASKFMDKDGFSFAVQKVSELIEGLKEDKVVEEAEGKVRELFALNHLPGTQCIATAGSPRLGFYEIDFGLGRLSKVELASIDRHGSFAMIDSRDGNGGIEVTVVFKKDEIERFASLVKFLKD